MFCVDEGLKRLILDDNETIFLVPTSWTGQSSEIEELYFLKCIRGYAWDIA